jgi:hypothetical protein
MAANNPSANGRERESRPKPIVQVPVIDNFGVSLPKFMAVSCLSAFINASILGVFLLVFAVIGATAGTTVDTGEVTPTAAVEDVEKTPDLTNTDLGEDDTQITNYLVDRIESVSVPGKVDPSAPVGITNAPEAAPMTIPPPPGSGGGTGGAPKMDEAGTGSMTGDLGGRGGIYNVSGFAGRSGATRQKMLTEGGGNHLSEQAVAAGLQWLALHQAQDGHWGLSDFNKHARTEPFPGGKISTDSSDPQWKVANDIAGTGFALLPFLGAGLTQKPPKKGTQNDYSKGIGAGLAFLIRKQDKNRGADSGNFGGQPLYSHAIATIAMCEAYGLTSDQTLKASAQMALNYLINAQDAAGGGWRYSPRTAGDMSVTGWCFQALKSGQMAGLSVPKATMKKVESFLSACESSDGGKYGYLPGGAPSEAMTAVGLLCRMYQGVNPLNPNLQKGIEHLKKHPPGATNDLYYEYYATQVMHHMEGENWNFWNKGPDGSGKGGIRDYLIGRQVKNTGGAANAGSWPPNARVGGRLGATSLSLLTLEVYYRHLPLYRRDIGEMKPDAQ